MLYQVFGLVSASFCLCLSSAAAEHIRLAGSDWFCSGRVEIYHNGVWGTVCDDNFDISDAEVVCRQLGCGQQSAVHASAYFGEGTGEIWLDDVSCSGNEASLSQCSHRGFGSNNCEHSEDVGVTCLFHQILPYQSCSGYVHVYHDRGWRPISSNGFDMNAANVACRQMGCGPASSTYPYHHGNWVYDISCSGSEVSLKECQHTNPWTYHSGSYVHVTCSGYPVRLIGPSRCAGRVEIYYSYAWQTVCDDGWDMNDAQVVCRQLGCGTALAATHSAYFGNGPDKILLDNVACTGSETYLTQCSHRGFLVQNCTHKQYAGVICSAGVIRLIGPNRCSGRVEIYNNGSWGTVCNNTWDINDARVVCRQMGCGTSLSIHHFGEGIGQINEVTCTGSERHLSECSQSGFGAQHCNHSQDAGVICSGPIQPHISLNPQDQIILGQNVNITCSLPGVKVEGTFVFKKSTGTFNQTVNSSSSSATINIPHATFNDQGAYKCQFQMNLPNENFSTLFSDTVQLTVNFPRPSINISPTGVISPDQNVSVICSVTDKQGGGSFLFSKYPGTFHQTVNSSTSSATFYIPRITFEDEGLYRCQFKVRFSNEEFSSNFSDHVQLYIKVILPKPSIIMDPAGVVTFGQLVAITCSISTQYLGGSFTLEKTSASFYKTQLSSTNSSTFRFLEANSGHVGDYRCYYNKTLHHQTFISPLSDNVTISVTGG